MTRKDYQRIARALLLVRNKVDKSETAISTAWRLAIQQAAFEIARELQYDNPQFNRTHFVAVVRGEKELDSRPPRQAV